MGIINAVRKTIAYYKRNGSRAAFFAALERLSDGRKDRKYTYAPLAEAVLKEQRQEYKMLAESDNTVHFSIVVPLYNTPDKYLREMIESVINQTYGNWELVLADASEMPLDLAMQYDKDDPRIRYIHLDENKGISDNTNAGIRKATGDYIGLLDHDDVLTPDALYECSRVIRESMRKGKLARFSDCPIRLIYSDEDKFDDKKGRYYEYHQKPPFNMDYLMSNNYICHFTMLRADIIKRLKLRGEYDGAQDFDLFLRACAETALFMPQASGQIVHIDKVLYHWRCHQGSTAANPASKTYAYEAGKRALQSLMDNYGIKATASEMPHVGFYRLTYDPDVFSQRSDVGCVGGKLLDKRNRICGGMYRKNGTLAYEKLPEGFSGGLQHRAVLQQDAYAVDIRCMAVRNELIPLYEEVTGVRYQDSFEYAKRAMAATEAASVQDPFEGLDQEELAAMSLRLGSEIRKRGYRIIWDPQVIKRI